MKIKKIAGISRGTNAHWVGDGFPVNTMISYHTQGEEINPFLLLDYAGPAEFESSDRPRGWVNIRIAGLRRLLSFIMVKSSIKIMPEMPVKSARAMCNG
jgi:hypothetical protein